MSANEKTTLLRPSLKWPGGKFRELHEILPFVPERMNNFVDPFTGAGAVPLNINPQNVFGHIILNDIDPDLMSFYALQGDSLALFYQLIQTVQDARDFAAQSNVDVRNFEENFYGAVARCVRRLHYSLREVDISDIVSKEMKRRQAKINLIQEQGRQPDQEFARTAVFATIYYIVRHVFNITKPTQISEDGTITSPSPIRIAMWFILRELSYGGMMRYSEKGFNIPYGGVSYNRKNLTQKIPLITAMHQKFKDKAVLSNMDFMPFLEKNAHNPEDFVFLDPPYDTSFSSYSSRDNFMGHEKIFEWMERTPARYVMITKKTPLIDGLLAALQTRRPDVTSETFQKKYAANIRNRNSRDAIHLRIQKN